MQTIEKHLRDNLRPTRDQAELARTLLDLAEAKGNGKDWNVTVLLKVTGGAGEAAEYAWEGTETVEPVESVYEIHGGQEHPYKAMKTGRSMYRKGDGATYFYVTMENADRLREFAAEQGVDIDAEDELARDFNVRFHVQSIPRPRD